LGKGGASSEREEEAQAFESRSRVRQGSRGDLSAGLTFEGKSWKKAVDDTRSGRRRGSTQPLETEWTLL